MKYLLFVADKDIWLKKKDIAYEEFKDIEATPQGIFQPEMIYDLGKDTGYKERRPEGKWLLCNSWSYKYAFFNLLYIMSKIDPDKQVLLWVGI